MTGFLDDVWQGLHTSPKRLQSKYFYDERGDALFREIMQCPEYYLTRCEMEIFSTRCGEMATAISSRLREFDLVELGPGDATKSVHLLRAVAAAGVPFTYIPIDISEHVIEDLSAKLPAAIPGLKLEGLNGDYFAMLSQMNASTAGKKVVLLLGSNIGNFEPDETPLFLQELHSNLSPGDLVLTGFDLKKAAAIVLPAYNDQAGITRRFNLNLLQRINSTLDADFDIAQFEHRPVYDERTGACRSYIVSRRAQQVRIGERGTVELGAGEPIYTEISQKYTVAQTDELAAAAGFNVLGHYLDSKGWFLDALWERT